METADTSAVEAENLFLRRQLALYGPVRILGLAGCPGCSSSADIDPLAADVDRSVNDSQRRQSQITEATPTMMLSMYHIMPWNSSPSSRIDLQAPGPNSCAPQREIDGQSNSAGDLRQ